jgi:hypothetical protein
MAVIAAHNLPLSTFSTGRYWLQAARRRGGVEAVASAGAALLSAAADAGGSADREREPGVAGQLVQAGLAHAQARKNLPRDAALPRIDRSPTDSFNAGVDEYNSRCGSFRYRTGDLERASREVEQLRSQIVDAARRFSP